MTDSTRQIEVKLNANFAELYAAFPAATEHAPLEVIRLTVSSDNGTIDTTAETQRKLNAMYGALFKVSGGATGYAPIFLDGTNPLVGGFNAAVTVSAEVWFSAALAVLADVMLGASFTFVTVTVTVCVLVRLPSDTCTWTT